MTQRRNSNHWALLTGLYAESHGIIANTFWDPITDAYFDYTKPERSWGAHWWLGEPVRYSSRILRGTSAYASRFGLLQSALGYVRRTSCGTCGVSPASLRFERSPFTGPVRL